MGRGGAAFSQPQRGAPFQFVQHIGPGLRRFPSRLSRDLSWSRDFQH